MLVFNFSSAPLATAGIKQLVYLSVRQVLWIMSHMFLSVSHSNFDAWQQGCNMPLCKILGFVLPTSGKIPESILIPRHASAPCGEEKRMLLHQPGSSLWVCVIMNTADEMWFRNKNLLSFLHAFHDPLDWYFYVFVWTVSQNDIVTSYEARHCFSPTFCYICL
jgi:hypothetical protein